MLAIDDRRSTGELVPIGPKRRFYIRMNPDWLGNIVDQMPEFMGRVTKLKLIFIETDIRDPRIKKVITAELVRNHALSERFEKRDHPSWSARSDCPRCRQSGVATVHGF
jgi:hypothetical protein